MVGIYIITNIVNNKIYIGKSKNIEKRWKEHIRHSKDEYSRKKPAIHVAINKYGSKSFKFEVLEECDISQLNEKEKYYIELYHSNNKKIGYNLTNGGDNGPVMYGNSNPKSVIDIKYVKYIRNCYKDGIYKMVCYNTILKDVDLNYNTFCSIWHGRSYINVMMEVYTNENRLKQKKISYEYRTYKHCNKYKCYVLEIRKKKLEGMKRIDAYKLYSFINENAFNDIWRNHTFKYIIP